MKFFDFIDFISNSLETKGVFFAIISTVIGFGIGSGSISSAMISNGYFPDHYIIGSIGQFVYLALDYAQKRKKGVIFVSNLDAVSHLIWNIIKIICGGFLALFFTPIISQKVFTIFIGYEWPLSFILGIMASFLIKWIEKIMKWKEKQFDDATGIQNYTLDDEGAPKPPTPPIKPPSE